jgi:hypothetical protein
MKRVGKWILIGLGGLLGILVLAVVGVLAYINYEGPKTKEQKNSLEIIRELKNMPQPTAFSEKLPNVEPEIYDDRRAKHTTPEGHLKK